MDWANERYVRLYLRDTVTWRRWSWQARAVFGLLLRKVDRSGVLDTGRDDKAEALALIVDVPTDVAARALAEWVSAGSVVIRETALAVPSFLVAQETPQSDRVRQAESREKRKAATMRSPEDARHTMSHGVTRGHAVSQPVTPDQTSLSEPDQTSLSVPDQPGLLSRGRRTKKHDQPELPGVPPAPPKEPSRADVLWMHWVDSRDLHCYGMGLGHPGPPDANVSPAFRNTVFARLLSLWPDSKPLPADWARDGDLPALLTWAEANVVDMFGQYLKLAWPADCVARINGKDTETPQPWPFSAFASEKVWRRFVDVINAPPTADEAA